MNTTNRLTKDELQKLRNLDFSKQPGFVKAETVLAREIGETGSPERAEFDGKRPKLTYPLFDRRYV